MIQKMKYLYTAPLTRTNFGTIGNQEVAQEKKTLPSKQIPPISIFHRPPFHQIKIDLIKENREYAQNQDSAS